MRFLIPTAVALALATAPLLSAADATDASDASRSGEVGTGPGKDGGTRPTGSDTGSTTGNPDSVHSQTGRTSSDPANIKSDHEKGVRDPADVDHSKDAVRDRSDKGNTGSTTRGWNTGDATGAGTGTTGNPGR